MFFLGETNTPRRDALPSIGGNASENHVGQSSRFSAPTQAASPALSAPSYANIARKTPPIQSQSSREGSVPNGNNSTLPGFLGARAYEYNQEVGDALSRIRNLGAQGNREHGGDVGDALSRIRNLGNRGNQE